MRHIPAVPIAPSTDMSDVRRFQNRRAKRGGRRAREYSWSEIFGMLGVQRLTDLRQFEHTGYT